MIILSIAKVQYLQASTAVLLCKYSSTDGEVLQFGYMWIEFSAALSVGMTPSLRILNIGQLLYHSRIFCQALEDSWQKESVANANRFMNFCNLKNKEKSSIPSVTIPCQAKNKNRLLGKKDTDTPLAPC